MDPNITIQKVYGSNILGYPVMVMTALHVCVCVCGVSRPLQSKWLDHYICVP